jgi:hypothetical protein
MILNLYLLNVCIMFSFHNYYFLNIKYINIYIFIFYLKKYLIRPIVKCRKAYLLHDVYNSNKGYFLNYF